MSSKTDKYTAQNGYVYAGQFCFCNRRLYIKILGPSNVIYECEGCGGEEDGCECDPI